MKYVLIHMQLDVDPVVFLCDGVYATLKSLCSIVELSDCELDYQYVRVASRIYTKMWAKRWIGQSKKLMMDPGFATDVLADEGDLSSIVSRLSEEYWEILRNEVVDINSVFIPI